MRRIYHILAPSDWQAESDQPYEAESLKTEGFIHCSNRDQVARVANLFYATVGELLVLCINADVLGDRLRDEDPGVGETFPHVYGPIERSGVLAVTPLRRGPDGRWVLEE
jgi:uncharacterized protein (DUF952 family)